MAEAFVGTYSSVYSTDYFDLPFLHQVSHLRMEDVVIRRVDVLAVLQGFKPILAALQVVKPILAVLQGFKPILAVLQGIKPESVEGPDDLYPRFLKKCSETYQLLLKGYFSYPFPQTHSSQPGNCPWFHQSGRKEVRLIP